MSKAELENALRIEEMKNTIDNHLTSDQEKSDKN